MRVPARIVCSGLAVLLIGGCAPYRYAYDHRDELHRQDQFERNEPSRRVERPRRVAASAGPPAAKPRTTVVAKPKPAYKPPQRAPVATARVTESDEISKPTPPIVTTQTESTTAKAPAVQVAAPTVAPPVARPTAAAPPVGADAAGSVPSPEARKEISDGYRLLRAGFVKKARERFAAAMPTAAADATLAAARSMDPSYLASVAFPDVEPDAEQARRLYRRALMLGAGEAKSDLERLEGASASAARNAPSAQ